MDFLVNINLNKNELQNAVIQNLSVHPSAPKEGQIYYNTSDKLLYQFKGSSGWSAVGAPYELPIATESVLGGVKIGAGLNIDESGVLTVTGGGVADSVAWNNVTGRPFESINLTELEVNSNGKILGIKEVPQSKVSGLLTALNTKLSEIKVNGASVPSSEGSVNITVPTKNSQLENDKNYISAIQAPVQSVNNKTGVISLNAKDVNAVSTSGDTMTGVLAMGNNKITGVADGTANTDAVNKKQLDEAITSIGTVFNLKGSKPTKQDLPSSGNTIGDVWYVEDESVGYIWIKDSGSEGRWEQLGPSIDLSNYLTKNGLAQSTGSATNNAMSQKAVTDSLNLKADKTTVANIPIVKKAQGVISTSANSVIVPYNGDTIINTYAIQSNNEQAILDIDIAANQVTFSVANNPSQPITCIVIYM